MKASDIVDYGQFTIDVSKKVTQSLAEHPENIDITCVRVAQMSITETGGLALGVAIDVMVNNESWPQALASQLEAWAVGGLVAIGLGTLGAPAVVIGVAGAIGVYVGNLALDTLWEWSSNHNLGYTGGIDPTDSTHSTMSDIRNLLNTASTIPSPIVLDLNGDGVTTTALTSGTYFDHAGDGFAEQTAWVSAEDGLLVRDLNHNGTIDTGAELFGNNTVLANTQKAANGFLALADLDSNKDGKIDSADAAFSELQIWKDSDGDGITSTGELHSLAELGIASISAAYTASSTVDANGNSHSQTGTYTTTDGQTRSATDVWFKTDSLYSFATEILDVPEDISNLPEISGYGQMRSLSCFYR